jgi:hypothetical protein
MVNDGYRDEIGAAHVRIAHLEEQLAAREGSDTSLVKRLESEHAQLSVAPRRIATGSVMLGVLCFLLTLPLVVHELRSDGAVSALVALLCTFAFSGAASAAMRWMYLTQRRNALAIAAENLAEARRVRRLEAEVAELRAAAVERPKVRVDNDQSALEIEDEVEVPEVKAHRRASNRSR